MADLVDRSVFDTGNFAQFSPDPAVVRLAPLDEIDELRDEIRALKLHLAMVHSCSYPDGESFDDGAE